MLMLMERLGRGRGGGLLCFRVVIVVGYRAHSFLMIHLRYFPVVYYYHDIISLQGIAR